MVVVYYAQLLINALIVYSINNLVQNAILVITLIMQESAYLVISNMNVNNVSNLLSSVLLVINITILVNQVFVKLAQQFLIVSIV